MTPEIMLTLAIIAGALVLFASERFPAEIVALGVMLAIILTGLLPSAAAFAGFGSSTVMMILGLLIMTAALNRTGVIDLVGQQLSRIMGRSQSRTTLIIMSAAGGLSSFMSNAASTAFFLPLVIRVANRSRFSVSKLLLPMAFSTQLASAVTLVATSTNLVVSGIMTRYDLAPLGVLELTPIGLPILIAGVAYMWLIGIRLIPDRTPIDKESAGDRRIYVTEAVLTDGSPLAGKTLKEAAFGRDFDATVLRVLRDGEYLRADADLRLQLHDLLVLACGRDEVLKLKTVRGVAIREDTKPIDTQFGVGLRVFETIVTPDSLLIGRTLRGVRPRARFGFQVLAIQRHGEPIPQKLSEIRMHLGDVLLVQGDPVNIEALEQSGMFRILTAELDGLQPDLRRAPLAVGIFAASLALALFGIVDLPVATLSGAVLAVMTRCITPEEAYRQVEWKALILIGSMLALGAAMESTGTAAYLAGQFVNLVGDASPVALMGAFFLLTVLLTQPLSNQAAAVVVLPIALQTALQLGLNPRPFAIMIAVAASCGFLTPLEPSCVMVYGPGRYRFMDFVVVGAPLTVIIFVIVMLIAPSLWMPG